MPLSDAGRKRWLAALLSTEPVDRVGAEHAVRQLYAAAGLESPANVCWFDSPASACWAVAALIESRQRHWAPLLAEARRTAAGRERFEAARARLTRCAGQSTWDRVTAAIGDPVGMRMQSPPHVPAGLIQPAIITARLELFGGDVSALFSAPMGDQVLYEAEQSLWGRDGAVLTSGVTVPVTGPLLSQCFFADYPFASMAADEEAASRSTSPALLAAAWTVARTTGPWWPFRNGVLMIDRPTELHATEQGLLHRGDGPAIVYRDGTSAYAWEGQAVREEWILHPDQIAPGVLRQLPKTLRAFIESRGGSSSSARTAKKKSRPSEILSAELPLAVEARLEMLRGHAGGTLPWLDAYVAGQHKEVWSALQSQGPAVRQDPQAADALAVASETMRRVAHNVRIVIGRLKGMGYRFGDPEAPSSVKVAIGPGATSIDFGDIQTAGSEHAKGLFDLLNRLRGAVGQAGRATRSSADRSHVPPDARAAKLVRRLEKRAGALPLSLRAFYEIVGAVDLNGTHPSLAPRSGSRCPDPLVVYGAADALDELESWDEDDDAAQITLAPDDLHKAGTSGGDAYAMSVPDPRADGELLNERHGLLFVDYLRLCFEWGGFPGYEGLDQGIPPEIVSLRHDLLPF
jgi:hypothetical protein